MEREIMQPWSSPRWSTIGVIGLALLVGAGAVAVVPASTHVGLAAATLGIERGAGPRPPPTIPSAGPLNSTTLNESTLVLSNSTLVPGDFAATSGDLPSLETYDSATNEIFVESFYGDCLDVISGSSDRVVATVSTGAYPNTLAYDPVYQDVFFGLQTYDEVSLVNATTDLIERTVGIGIEPLAMAADPANGDLFVTGINSTGTAFVVVLNGSSGVVANSFSFGADRFPTAGPNGIVYVPSKGDFYIPSIATGVSVSIHGNLTLVSAAKEKVVKNISVPFQPSAILYAPATKDLYLANESGADLSVFVPSTGKFGGTVAIPNIADLLAYDATTAQIFVGITGNVSVVNTSSGTTYTTFPVLRNPSGLAFDATNGFLYVADYVWNNVSVVNATDYRVVTSALLGASPYNSVYDPITGDLYVADLLSSQLIVVNGTRNQVVGYIPLGTTPYGVAFDPKTQELYVDDYYAGNVSIVNPSSKRVIGYLPAGVEPWGIAYDGANHDLYVTNPGSDNITVLDPATRTVVTSLNFTTPPGAIAYNAKSATLFVGEYNVGNVSVLNARTNALIRNSSTGSEVYTIAIDPGTGHAFVGNYASDNVTILGPKGQELGKSVTAGVGVFGSVYDPANGDVYVVSFDSELVTVINSTSATGIGGYSTGVGPVAAAVDPSTGTVYVSDYDSDSLTLLSPTFHVATYNVTFRESGLPAGTYWWVRFDGSGLSGTARSLEFRDPNGSGQPYAVGEVSGYSASVEFGTVHVDGKSIVVKIAFSAKGPLALAPVARGPGSPVDSAATGSLSPLPISVARWER